MAVRDDTLVMPTLDHARAAAAVLADDGAASVLLFGSVAEGTSQPGSDIDLVAVFEDIDYNERYQRKWRLEAKCTAAAGAPVEVHVTDWPEWAHRTNKVQSSFEAAVSRGQQVLFEHEPRPGALRWDKEIGMPDSDMGEALQRLNDLTQALGAMSADCRRREDETRRVDGRSETDTQVTHERLRDVCAGASMAIENSLKALAALRGVASERTHSIKRLIDRARPLSDGVESALMPLQANTLRPSREDWDDISGWRIGAAYPSVLPQATLERTGRLARLLTHAAVTAAGDTVRRLLDAGADPEDERMAACRRRLSTAVSVLASGDVVVGVVPNTDPSRAAAPAQRP